MIISDLQRDTLHHAYIVHGNDFGILQRTIENLFSITLRGNPDVFIQSFDTVTASDARKIVQFADHTTFVAGAVKLLVIYFSTIGIEAQNILLKTLEEPSKHTHIFMLTPHTERLLPTVLSRCMQVTLHETCNNSVLGISGKDTEAFIAATVPERLKIIEKINKGKNKAVNKTRFLDMLDGIELYLHKHKPKEIGELETSWIMRVRVVLQAKKYMHDKGAMSKMLMESVAFII